MDHLRSKKAVAAMAGGVALMSLGYKWYQNKRELSKAESRSK